MGLESLRCLSIAVAFACLLPCLASPSMSPTDTPATPGEAPKAVTKDEAHELALKAVSGRKADTVFVILEDETIEKEFGWVFRYANKEYADSRDKKTLIRGLGPIIVERMGGAVHKLPTSLPPERAIREFEERWRKAQEEGKQAEKH